MISKVISAAPIGYEAEIIEVEGDSSRGLPTLQIVGMGNKSIDEAKERVRSAITNSNLDFPTKKLTINLAPAEIPKDGTYLDLPIAISILTLSGQLKHTEIENCGFAGELSLSGDIKPVRGILNIVEKIAEKQSGEIFIPKDNLAQARMIQNANIVGVANLSELFLHLKNEREIVNQPTKEVKKPKEDTVTFSDIVGQEQAKRALTVAIAGRHNILMVGPPGTGKTMLAKAALNLLPPLNKDEQLQVTKIHSLINANTSNNSRPFRSPHHTASRASLIGGGPKALPGEISLAHLGVLFLDEMPEYPKTVLESLRQPIEDKHITINRARVSSTYPADFMLIATMNPCPCGYLGDPKKQCSCSSTQILNYQRKISGPLLDRIDMVINVDRIDNNTLLEMTNNTQPTKSKEAKQIQELSEKQYSEGNSGHIYNNSLSLVYFKNEKILQPSAKSLLNQAAENLNLSARAYLKTLRVAKTIADLNSEESVSPSSISEALQYRNKTTL